MTTFICSPRDPPIPVAQVPFATKTSQTVRSFGVMYLFVDSVYILILCARGYIHYFSTYLHSGGQTEGKDRLYSGKHDEIAASSRTTLYDSRKMKEKNTNLRAVTATTIAKCAGWVTAMGLFGFAAL